MCMLACMFAYVRVLEEVVRFDRDRKMGLNVFIFVCLFVCWCVRVCLHQCLYVCENVTYA